jgi:hypothetical protein
LALSGQILCRLLEHSFGRNQKEWAAKVAAHFGPPGSAYTLSVSSAAWQTGPLNAVDIGHRRVLLRTFSGEFRGRFASRSWHCWQVFEFVSHRNQELLERMRE